MSTKQLQLPEQERELLLHHFPLGVVSVDIETTGLSPILDKIVELAAIKLTPNGELESFSTIINPERSMSLPNMAIHNISNEMAQNAPLFSDIFTEFKKFCHELPLIAHNARFDAGFLAVETHRQNLTLGKNKIYCSCQLSKSAFPGLSTHKLSELAKGLSLSLLNHHRAWDDAAVALQIFSKSLMALGDKAKVGLTNAYLCSFEDYHLKESVSKKSKTTTENKNQNLIDIFRPYLNPSLLSKNKNANDKNLVPKSPSSILEMIYNGGSHRGQLRPIRPISLLPSPNGDLLYAHCLLSDHYKYFALSKIKEVRSLTLEEQELWQSKLTSVMRKPKTD